MHGTISTPRQRCVTRRLNDWTLKEHEVLVTYWPDVSAIRRMLPHRTRRAICAFAAKCNLTKPVHLWTEEETTKLRQLVRRNVPRREIADALGMSLNQVAGRMGYLHLRYPRRPLRRTGHKLMDAIRERAFEMNMSLADLDAQCGTKMGFRRFSKTSGMDIRKMMKAVRFMEGELTAEWKTLH